MTAPSSEPSPLLTRAFFDRFLRVPDGGRFVPMSLHPEQLRVLTLWDELDEDGRPRYDEACLFWAKKCGKSSTGAGLVLAGLVAGQGAADREIILTASDLQQSKDIVFATCVRFVRRNAWLSKHVRILSHELLYKQTIIDPATGGRHVQEHVARSVPGRDARSQHGADPWLVVFDELHTQSDYSMLEALAASPARSSSRRLFLSYAGLRHQRHEGIPIHDYWNRAKAGTDPRLLASFIEGEQGWRSIPWITERFIEGQRRQFAAVPSKFRRLWLNEWTSDDTGTFLTGEEIAAAIDPTLTEPERGEPGISYFLGCDLGLTFDWSALCLTHVGSDHKLIVDAVRFWRGTRQRPVQLSIIEDEIIALSHRFKIARCVLDLWQSHYLSERLTIRGLINNFTVAVDPHRLDSMATALKRVLAARQIRIPKHPPELTEQLETITGVEQKRRDLIRFTSGSGSDAGKHDDIIVSLGLSMESQTEQIGRAQLPLNFTQCYRAGTVKMDICSCYLFNGPMPAVSGDLSCQACPGHRYVKEQYRKHLEAGGEAVGIRSYRQAHVLDNQWVAVVRANRDVQWMGL